MPTFIKTGYWVKAVKALKGYLNLDDYILSVVGGSTIGIYQPSTATITLQGNVDGTIVTTTNGEDFTPTLTHEPFNVIAIKNNAPITGFQWSYQYVNGFYDILIDGVFTTITDVKLVVQ